MKISVPGKSRTGKLAPSTPGHKTKVLAISGAVLLAASTFAAASPAPAAGPGPCAGIDLSTPTASGCTIESGEGNSFLIRSGNGGDGADVSGPPLIPGGLGGLGVLATGTYTNSSGGQEILIFVLGNDGTASTGSNDATIGADSYINVNGSGTDIIRLSGRGAGTDASGSLPGVAGSNGIVLSGSLPSGWTAAATAGTPRLIFTAGGTSGSSESSGPASLLAAGPSPGLNGSTMATEALSAPAPWSGDQTACGPPANKHTPTVALTDKVRATVIQGTHSSRFSKDSA